MFQPQSNLHSSQPGSIPTFFPKSTSARPAEADAQIPARLRTPAKINLGKRCFSVTSTVVDVP